MAAVNSLIGFLYQVVEASWMVASVVMKFFVAGVMARTWQLDGLSIKKFGENLQEYGRYAVLGTGLLGLSATLLGVSMQPNLILFSQVVAVAVLGYLFWRY